MLLINVHILIHIRTASHSITLTCLRYLVAILLQNQSHQWLIFTKFELFYMNYLWNLSLFACIHFSNLSRSPWTWFRFTKASVTGRFNMNIFYSTVWVTDCNSVGSQRNTCGVQVSPSCSCVPSGFVDWRNLNPSHFSLQTSFHSILWAHDYLGKLVHPRHFALNQGHPACGWLSQIMHRPHLMSTAIIKLGPKGPWQSA